MGNDNNNSIDKWFSSGKLYNGRILWGEDEMKTKDKTGVILVTLFLVFCLGPLLPDILAEEKEEPAKMYCPKTLISDNEICLNCHVMSGDAFRLIEFPEDAHIKYPINTNIIDCLGTKEGVFEFYGAVDSTKYDRLFEAFDFFRSQNIGTVTIEIYSYGGDLFSAWRIKGLFEDWRLMGGKLNTKVYGGAISAAAILFAAGDERIAHAQAEIMFHELWTFKFFDVSSPSDKEDEARVLRHLQDNIASWLATRCDLSKEELDNLMKKKEYWLTGKDAFEIGLATKLIGG